MGDELSKAAEIATAAIKGPDTPEAVKLTQRDDRWTTLISNLAGPAICAMIAGGVLLLSVGGTDRWQLWTHLTESIRAHYVGGTVVALAVMLGVLIWRLVGGKPRRIEIKAGPGSILIEGGEPDKS